MPLPGMPPRADMFYDETPREVYKYFMRVSSHNNPLQFVYNIRLDGETAADNKELLRQTENRAQADMFAALQRIQANNPDAEFLGWICEDQHGQVIRRGDGLSVYVKPQTGTVSSRA